MKIKIRLFITLLIVNIIYFVSNFNIDLMVGMCIGAVLILGNFLLCQK